MVHEVPWNMDVLNNFIKYGNLTHEEQRIMILRSMDYTDIEIADKLGFSVSTYYRRVRVLKKKYDSILKYHADMPTRNSIKEKNFEFTNKDELIEFVNNIQLEGRIVKLTIKRA